MKGARRWGALVAGPLLLAAGVKLLTMVWFSSAGAAAYDEGAYDRAGTEFGRLAALNLVEPWREPFGRGAALYRQGELQAAGAAFGDALELAPERCEVRFNLAVTIEAIGDSMLGGEVVAVEDIEDEAPLERYRTALDVIGARGCPDDDPEGPGARLELARQRITLKLGGEEAELPAPDVNSEDSADNEEENSSSQSPQEELQQRNQLGAQQRDDVSEMYQPDEEPSIQNEW